MPAKHRQGDNLLCMLARAYKSNLCKGLLGMEREICRRMFTLSMKREIWQFTSQLCLTARKCTKKLGARSELLFC